MFDLQSTRLSLSEGGVQFLNSHLCSYMCSFNLHFVLVVLLFQNANISTFMNSYKAVHLDVVVFC